MTREVSHVGLSESWLSVLSIAVDSDFGDFGGMGRVARLGRERLRYHAKPERGRLRGERPVKGAWPRVVENNVRLQN